MSDERAPESPRPRILDLLLAPRPEVATSIWLLRLRWFAVVGQLFTIAVSAFAFGVAMPLEPLLVLVGFTAATNVVYGVWLRGETAENVIRRERDRGGAELTVPSIAGVGFSAGTKSRVALLLMVLDLLTLTAMLHFSGGVDNPFSLFYLVNLAVAGVILRARWAWLLTILSILGFAALLFGYVPIDVLYGSDDPAARTTRHVGAFVAFATCAIVVTYFVTRTSEELLRRERQLRASEEERARGRQLEGLSTLAAGAAHELATPMSTVLVIARELQHHLQGVDVPETVRKDLMLIESELRHCRSILSRMRSAAGDHAGERWGQTTVGDLIDTVLEGVREPHRVEIEVGESVEETELWLPQEAVAQAVRNLVHNGLDASSVGPRSERTTGGRTTGGRTWSSENDGPVASDSGDIEGGGVVRLQATVEGSSLWLVVRDAGEGMSTATLDRVGEPFFTTKEPGRGMGLGLFLTRNVIQRLGGQLTFASQPGQGTVATVRLPLAAAVDGEGTSHAPLSLPRET